MKKSFKKAGAAVLSMSMLLAMGAVTMPVYAVDSGTPGGPGTNGAATNTVVNPDSNNDSKPDKSLPGSVYISMPGMFRQGEGDGKGADQDENDPDKWKYDYLGWEKDADGNWKTTNDLKITKAVVNIYRVASLDGVNGWKWENTTADTNIFVENDINALLTTNTTGNSQATSFDKLLDRLDPNTDNSDAFKTPSDELKNLASYLERQVASHNVTPVATRTLDNANQTAGFSLPEIDPALFSTNVWTDAEAPGTMNKIGYYLITTTTDQAGVLVQPVLISLKNGQENPKNISLKGTTISIAKRITHVGTKDEKKADGTEGTDGIKDNHDSKIYNDDTAKKGGTSATVGKNDIVHYEIFAQIPKYDDNVVSSSFEPFKIVDKASNGITIIENSVKAYVSKNDESPKSATISTADNKDLVGATDSTADYKYTVSNATDDHSLTVEMNLNQLRKYDTNTEGAYGSFENCYITVSFDAYVNRDENGTGVVTNEEGAANVDDIAFSRAYVNRVVYTAADGVKKTNGKLNADDTLNLEKIYKAWEAYINEGTTNERGEREAILNALAGGDYSTYLTTEAVSVLETSLTECGSTLYDGTFGGQDDFKNIEGGKTKEQQIKEAKIVAMLLAIDHYNETRNGEHNYAYMTYSNNYSLGTPATKAKTMANETQLNSVDLNLDKYVETLTLTHYTTGDDETLTNVKKYYTWAELEAYVKANPSMTIDTTKDTAAAGGEVLTAYKASPADADAPETLTDAEKVKIAAAARILLGQAKDTATANKEYSNKYKDEPVENAVFSLTNPDGDLVGYAVSTADGSLIKLVPDSTSVSQKPQKQTDEIKFWSDTADATSGYYTVYKLPQTTTDQERAWEMLQTGTYVLKEVYVPTGFKKWANDVNINVIALDKDGAEVTVAGQTSVPDGAYKARGWSATPTEIASQLTEAGKGTADTDAAAVMFEYYTNPENTKSAGILSHKIYNEYQDTLPATGGIGTVLFTAGGISVVLIAGALFVMYMKKKNSEEEE